MTRGPGFFISPEGEITMLKTTHIRTVTKNPELFGLSRNCIESIYIKHREKTAIEGKARDEILRRVLGNGWVRVRRHQNRNWSVQTGTVTDEKKRFIHQWAREILAGICGYTESDPYMPVKIEGLEDGFREKAPVGELAAYLSISVQ